MDNKETTMENTNGKDNNPINGRCLSFTLLGLDNGICNKPILVPINGIVEIFPVMVVGILNLGNTCFANATLQCVLNTTGLRALVKYFGLHSHHGKCHLVA